MPTTHPIHRRYYAEDLVRLRRAGERRRHAASQRRGRIDANPHQIDAVMFALRRIPEGGCILADEVGLGKTIEAGLVIAQLLTEGSTRVLIVVPRPLLGQWQHELYTLFGIQAVEVADASIDVAGTGVFLAGREYAGGNVGFTRLTAAPPFDLCLIDEAHEVFAGIYRRYDRYGTYSEDSPLARTAHRVRKIIGASPVLLLTAMPIQNSLAELWGLIQFIDPTGTLLGDRPTFEDLFCTGSDARTVADEQRFELRRRLSTVVQRTLRRQAQEFLDKPFVGRRAQLFEYTMSAEERSLYDDVTNYLLQPSLHAFEGRSRQLLLLGFHRRMASSIAALALSLDRVAKRLRTMIGDDANADDSITTDFLADLEDVDEPAAESVEDSESADVHAGREPEPALAVSRGNIRTELALVESFVERARALPHDSKAQSLISAVRLVTGRGAGRQKVVIFTESLTTQDYLRDLLIARAGVDEQDITLFRGINDTPRAREALSRWRQEVEPQIAAHMHPSAGVAVRLALVHEFKTRSKVLISSEAGAKGLNLQFCDTLINYDLPWNPQRIEQRIGRCHRYGQTHDVTVINFLARDNEAQRLTFEILSTKLDLFGKVLDSSDVVLQTPRSEASDTLASALGPNFEAELRRIWDRARSVSEVEDELRRLRDSMEERRLALDSMRERTLGLIETNLDESVREVFHRIRRELPATLEALDEDLERVLTAYLDVSEIPWGRAQRDGRRLIHIGASRRLPAEVADGTTVALGTAHDLADVEPLYAAHPLIEAAVAEARHSGAGTFRVRFSLKADAPAALLARRGTRGRLALTKVLHRSFEREDRLIVTAVFEDAEVLRPAEAATALIHQHCEDIAPFDRPLAVSAADLDEVIDEELFMDQTMAADADQQSFERAMDQLDQYVADRVLVRRRARQEVVTRLNNAQRAREAALGADKRAREDMRVRGLELEIERLDGQIAPLLSHTDADYERWKARAHRRRYDRPQVERLLDAEFVIA
jgi:hypothetical protein